MAFLLAMSCSQLFILSLRVCLLCRSVEQHQYMKKWRGWGGALGSREKGGKTEVESGERRGRSESGGRQSRGETSVREGHARKFTLTQRAQRWERQREEAWGNSGGGRVLQLRPTKLRQGEKSGVGC